MNSIEDINTDHFISVYKKDNLLSLKYAIKSPYLLLIIKNIEKRECVIEFTSKILRQNYKDLIRMNNIRQCLENINNIGICRLNIDNILNYGEVVKCDVTKDVNMEREKFEEMIRFARSNIRNYRKWECNDYYGGDGLKIENKVKTPSCKKRCIFYDKHKELQRYENEDFFNIFSNEEKEELLLSFQNVTRFELNLKSKKIIRDLLHIHDNNLMTVLYSDENPILKVVDEAFKDAEERTVAINNTKDYETSLILKDCGNDLAAVEAKIRSLTPRNTSIERKMRRFREFCDRHLQPQINIRELVA